MTAEEQKAAEQERRAQQERWSDRTIDQASVIGRRGWRRLAWIGLTALVVVLLVTLPPLLNISRYQHRVASSISGSIGRPVRFDNISLHMLPWPGFKIENFVVYEDPTFGAEPAMRANRVDARIRIASLWRRRVEVSRITLDGPTVNLVRNAAGHWNMQGVVTQAAEVPSAPTAQQTAGEAPRFPYIEGSDARVNIKLGDTKLPYALVDADFALWLPTSQEWHLRLAGKPLRSDTDASDIGKLRLEATLRRGGGNTAQSPFTLQANWKPTPMGEASKLFLGRDTGWRGTASAEIAADGTPGAMHVKTDVHLHDLRRAEFVPPETMQVDVHCEGKATGLAHQLSGVRCAMPTAQHGSLLDQLPFFKSATTAATDAPDVLTLQADVPDTTQWSQASTRIALPSASPEYALRWLRLFSTRMPARQAVGGTFQLSMLHEAGKQGGTWLGTLDGTCLLPHAASTNGDTEAWHIAAMLNDPLHDEGVGTAPGVVVRMYREPAATASALPASAEAKSAQTMDGRVTADAAILHYSSANLARDMSKLLPALADDLPTALTGPAISERRWGTEQVWSTQAPSAAPADRKRRRRR